MEIYIKLFEVLSPVFFIVGIGYFLGKQKSDIDTTFITNYSAPGRNPYSRGNPPMGAYVDRTELLGGGWIR